MQRNRKIQCLLSVTEGAEGDSSRHDHFGLLAKADATDPQQVPRQGLDFNLFDAGETSMIMY